RADRIGGEGQDAWRLSNAAVRSTVEAREDLDGPDEAALGNTVDRLAVLQVGIEAGGNAGNVRAVLAQHSVAADALRSLGIGGTGADLRPGAVRAEADTAGTGVSIVRGHAGWGIDLPGQDLVVDLHAGVETRNRKAGTGRSRRIGLVHADQGHALVQPRRQQAIVLDGDDPAVARERLELGAIDRQREAGGDVEARKPAVEALRCRRGRAGGSPRQDEVLH